VSIHPASPWSGLVDSRPTCDEGSGENLAQKGLERWNAAVGVDEGKNITSANQCLS